MNRCAIVKFTDSVEFLSRPAFSPKSSDNSQAGIYISWYTWRYLFASLPAHHFSSLCANDFCDSTNIHLEFCHPFCRIELGVLRGPSFFLINYNCVQAPRTKFLTDILHHFYRWTSGESEYMKCIFLPLSFSLLIQLIHSHFYMFDHHYQMTPCSNNLQVAKTSYHSGLISNSISKLQSQHSY